MGVQLSISLNRHDSETTIFCEFTSAIPSLFTSKIHSSPTLTPSLKTRVSSFFPIASQSNSEKLWVISKAGGALLPLARIKLADLTEASTIVLPKNSSSHKRCKYSTTASSAEWEEE